MTTDVEALIERLRKYTGTGFVVDDARDAADALHLQAECIRELEADRDSWRDQASQRVEDWKHEHDRVLALEAKCVELERGAKLLREIASLKRHDINKAYPTSPRRWATINAPIEMLERIDASIAAQAGSKEGA